MRPPRRAPLLALLVLLAFPPAPASRGASAFAPAPPSRARRRLDLGVAAASLPAPAGGAADDAEEEEEEWVEEEFELLTERDFYNTEWRVGTLMEDAKKIDQTWVRLVTTEDGENKAIWGDNSQGKWAVDVPSQFFSISKETFGGWMGKKIWAGTIEDFYYLEGTVRGWSPIMPASVVGQWQMMQLGVVDGHRVSDEERGAAPWFARGEEEDDAGDAGGLMDAAEGESPSAEDNDGGTQ